MLYCIWLGNGVQPGLYHPGSGRLEGGGVGGQKRNKSSRRQKCGVSDSFDNAMNPFSMAETIEQIERKVYLLWAITHGVHLTSL